MDNPTAYKELRYTHQGVVCDETNEIINEEDVIIACKAYYG